MCLLNYLLYAGSLVASYPGVQGGGAKSPPAKCSAKCKRVTFHQECRLLHSIWLVSLQGPRTRYLIYKRYLLVGLDSHCNSIIAQTLHHPLRLSGTAAASNCCMGKRTTTILFVSTTWVYVWLSPPPNLQKVSKISIYIIIFLRTMQSQSTGIALVAF